MSHPNLTLFRLSPPVLPHSLSSLCHVTQLLSDLEIEAVNQQNRLLCFSLAKPPVCHMIVGKQRIIGVNLEQMLWTSRETNLCKLLPLRLHLLLGHTQLSF